MKKPCDQFRERVNLAEMAHSAENMTRFTLLTCLVAVTRTASVDIEVDGAIQSLTIDHSREAAESAAREFVVLHKIESVGGTAQIARALRRRQEPHAYVRSPLFAVVRELDGFLDSQWFKGAYKYLNAPIVLAFVVIAFKHRSDLLAELGRAGPPLSMVLMFLGFFLVVGYSQVLGQKELWQAAMGEDYLRLVKNTVEESSELVGFLMILFGAVEAALFEPGRSA